MADNGKLIRNPQNGRMFSKFESMSKRADLSVQQHGLTREEKALLETKATVVMDSDAVQGYLLPMTQLVEDWKGNVGELRKIIASITEMNQLAQMHDPALSAAEKRRVDGYAKELIRFINRKTSLFLRATRQLQNVARKRKDAVVDHMSSSPSAVFRSIGRVLSSKERADKDMLQARANVFKHILGQQKSIAGVLQPAAKARKGSASEPMRPWQADVERPPTPDALGPVKSKRKKSDDGVEVSSTLDELLVVNKAVLHQVTVTNQLLRTNGEFAIQNQEAQERALGDSSVKLLPGSTGVGKKQKGKAGGSGLFDTLFSGLRSALGDLTKMILGPLGLLEGFKLFKGGLGSILSLIPKALGGGAEGGGLASRTIGGIAKGLLVDAGVHGLGSLISSTEPEALKGTGKQVSNMGHYAGAGAAVGSIFPVVGTAAGATIGAGVGAYKELYDQRSDVKELVTHPQEVLSGVTRSREPGLDSFNYNSYKEGLAKRESHGDYKAENSLGYLGKYQMGAAALEDAGLVKKGASKKGSNKVVLADPNNWNLKGGKQAFLNSSEVQETAMRLYTRRNLHSLSRLHKVGPETQSADIASALAQAHLGGVGNVNNSAFKDAYGTGNKEYAELGRVSQTPAANLPRGRDAKAMAALSNATRAGVHAPIIVAPQMTLAGGGGKSAPPVFVPTPMKPENSEDSLRMVRGVNGI